MKHIFGLKLLVKVRTRKTIKGFSSLLLEPETVKMVRFRLHYGGLVRLGLGLLEIVLVGLQSLQHLDEFALVLEWCPFFHGGCCQQGALNAFQIHCLRLY